MPLKPSRRLLREYFKEDVKSDEFKDFIKKLDPVARRITKHIEGSKFHNVEAIDRLMNSYVDLVRGEIDVAFFVHLKKSPPLIDQAEAVLSKPPSMALLVAHNVFSNFPSKRDQDLIVKRLGELADEVDEKFKKIEEVPSEAAPGSSEPFGKYVFAPVRPWQVPEEPNTRDEEITYRDLANHVENNVPMGPRSLSFLRQLISKGDYPEFFHEPKSEYVFRGVVMDRGRLEKLIGELPPDAEDLAQRSRDVSVTVVARRAGVASTSWTTDWESAQGFSRTSEEGFIPTVFVARVSDNPDGFLEGPDGFYKADPLNKFKLEKETIALGPIKLCRVYWAQWPNANGPSYSELTVGEFEETVKEGLRLIESTTSTPDEVDEYVASEDFQRDAKKLDDILRPVLPYTKTKHVLNILLNYVDDFAEDNRAGYMVAAYVGQGGLGGDVSVMNQSWDDPVYCMYRLHRLRPRDSLRRDDFAVFINMIGGAVDAFLKEAKRVESLPPEVNPPDAVDPVFGKFVFAPQRGIDVPPEENTPEEEHVYDQLSGHVLVGTPMDSRSTMTLMQVLDDDMYPSIFHEPKSQYVFRGLTMSWSRFARMIGETDLPDDRKTHSKDVSSRVKVPKDAGADKNTTSWTTNWTLAREFADNTAGTDRVAAVLVARVSDNPDTFIEGPGGFYKVGDLRKYEEESEVVALGSVKLCKVYWTRGRMVQYAAQPEIREGKMSVKLLRRLVRETLMNEVDVEELSDVCFAAGSTHVMKTCRIGGDKYFLKFSDDSLFDEGFDPSLQILIEYLAYRIYGLYAGINIPSPELVYDRAKKRVGLATTPATGKQALVVGTDPKLLGKMLSRGVYVDIFLANWDVIGTGSGNVFVDRGKATRIDPGGSLTFRAQGGRKGSKFSPRAGELKSMLGGDRGAGLYFKHSKLVDAAEEFLAVDWSTVESEIDTVRNEVAEELETRGMSRLLDQWNADCDEIKGTLKKRHVEVAAHAGHVLSGG